MSILILEKRIIDKNSNKWKIFLNSTSNSIIITLYKLNSNYFYQSTFEEEYFYNIELFNQIKSMKNIIEILSKIINQKEFEIEENGKKLILISSKEKIIKVNLLLEKKEKFFLKIKSDNTLKKKENNLIQSNLQLKHLFYTPNKNYDMINLISSFPSGNIISISNDRTITIYDINLNVIQIIDNAHEDLINYINIKDENNFVICSYDCIKTFYKKIYGYNSNKFYLNKIINNAHYDSIYCVIYSLKENIISCSRDKTMKIWEENKNNNYQCITTIKLSFCIKSLLLFKEKNILISSGIEGTNIWNLNNLKCIFFTKETICYHTNMLKKLDDDRFIVGDETIKIISISKKKIVKEINNDFQCIGTLSVVEKGIFLFGGYKVIKIYRSDNYSLVNVIKDAHEDFIFDFILLKNGLIASYGRDRTIRFWTLYV